MRKNGFEVILRVLSDPLGRKIALISLFAALNAIALYVGFAEPLKTLGTPIGDD